MGDKHLKKRVYDDPKCYRRLPLQSSNVIFLNEKTLVGLSIGPILSRSNRDLACIGFLRRNTDFRIQIRISPFHVLNHPWIILHREQNEFNVKEILWRASCTKLSWNKIFTLVGRLNLQGSFNLDGILIIGSQTPEHWVSFLSLVTLKATLFYKVSLQKENLKFYLL